VTPTSIIVIGGEVPEKYKGIPSLLIRLPGEEGPTGADIIAPQTIDDCLIYLRNRYADHPVIASLGGTMVISDHPIAGTDEMRQPLTIDKSPHGIRLEWAPKIEAKLCELLDDLGNCALDSWRGSRHAILNGDRIANSPTSRELKDAHKGEPAVVIASGPSASRYLDEVARIRSGVRIFCADTMLAGLLRRGIVPDYVCAIEREAAITKVLSEGADCGATLIASPVIEPECAAKWRGNTLFWWAGDDFYRWMDPGITVISSGRSAGSLAVAAAFQAGCGPIYLVGHDLAYESGESHAPDAHEIAHAANKKADAEAVPNDPHRERLPAMGNSGHPVETNGLWNRVRGDIEGIISNYPGQVAINVNAWSGARIAGAEVGNLPSMPRNLPMRTALRSSGVSSPLRRSTSVRLAVGAMRRKLEDLTELIEIGGDLDKMAEDLQVSRLCGIEHAPLIQYVSRAIYNAMLLRLHFYASRGMSREICQANALHLTARTLLALCDRMLEELP
jgi:hypothetical protein